MEQQAIKASLFIFSSCKKLIFHICIFPVCFILMVASKRLALSIYLKSPIPNVVHQRRTWALPSWTSFTISCGPSRRTIQKVRPYNTAFALGYWLIDYISAASHNSITTFQDKMNLTFMRHCNAVTSQECAVRQHNPIAVQYKRTLMVHAAFTAVYLLVFANTSHLQQLCALWIFVHITLVDLQESYIRRPWMMQW